MHHGANVTSFESTMAVYYQTNAAKQTRRTTQWAVEFQKI
jgi:hypothetical protein